MGNHAARTRARTVFGVLLLSPVALLWPVGPSFGAGPFLAEDQDAVVITFDDYPANISGTGAAPQITDQYANQGVVFPDGVTALRFTDDSFPPAPELPRSPQVVITTCYSQEFCTNRIAMTFTTDTQRVAVFAGTSAALAEPGLVVMTAFDAQGTLLTRSSVELPAGGLVPAQKMLDLEDTTGRIHSAEIGWGNDGSSHDHLVLDDLTITPFVARPGLTPSPSELNLTLHDQVERQTITVNNTGNVALTDLNAVFHPDLVPTEPVADVQLGVHCPDTLTPGRACTVTLVVHPKIEGRTNGVIEFTTTSLPGSNETVGVLFRLPVVVAVSPAGSTPTESPTSSGTPTSTPTATVQPTSDRPTPPSDSTYDPATWVQPVAGGLIAVLLAALIFVGASTLGRRLRRSDLGADESRAQGHPAGPSITVRSDPGRSAIDDWNHSVLTLVAVGPRPVTTITEEQP